MKILLLLIPLSLLFTACPTTESNQTGHKTAAASGSARRGADEESEPSKIRPHRGMTRGQVRKLYGDPDDQRVTSNGETWFYFFNRGHYFIPYYFGKARTATFHFNESGILTEFEYNQED
jgi:outer membrane protein assembly factor BamE (lipoprotein component of BamABCDE complex)